MATDDNDNIDDVNITLPSDQHLLISQPSATQPTTIRLAVTQTTISVDGRTVLTSRTDIVTVTVQDYILQQQTQDYQTFTASGGPAGEVTVPVIRRVPSTEIVCVEKTASPGTEWTGCRKGGTVTTTGYRNQESAGMPSIQINWGSGYTTLGTLSINSGKSLKGTFSWAANVNSPNAPIFKNVNTKGTGVSGITFTGETVRNVQVDVADTANIAQTGGAYEAQSRVLYRVVPNPDGSTTTSTSVPIDPIETLETRTNPGVTSSVFNPRPSALMTQDGIFSLPDSLEGPVIDLFSYIQADINS